MTRNLTDDNSNTDKTAPVPADKLVAINTETNPDSLVEISLSNLLKYISGLAEASSPALTDIIGILSGGTPKYVTTQTLRGLSFTPRTTYSPTVASSSGTITSSTVNTARYAIIGDTHKVDVDVTISNNGTGSGALNISLPGTVAITAIGVGRNLTDGRELQATATSGGTTLGVRAYDNSYPVATGDRIVVSVLYSI